VQKEFEVLDAVVEKMMMLGADEKDRIIRYLADRFRPVPYEPTFSSSASYDIKRFKGDI